MNMYRILGQNIFTNRWEPLGIIESTSSRGANQKAHYRFGLDYREFLVSIIK